MKQTDKPTILIGSWQVNGIYQLIVSELEKAGFAVVDISYDHTFPPFRYPSSAARAAVFFKKNILRQKNAKQRLVEDFRGQHFDNICRRIRGQIAGHPHFDHTLILGGQIYPPDLIGEIKAKTRGLTVAYQSDALSRFPDIWQTFFLYDRVYVFDPADIAAYSGKVYPATNFYFPPEQTAAGTVSDVYFLGSHLPELQRHEAVAAFARYAEASNLKLDFTIRYLSESDFRRHDTLYPKNVRATMQSLTFAENISREQNSRVLIDFKPPIHSGLSFRPFEALGYRKKLITTNPDNAKDDIYHPDNNYICHGKTYDGIDEFLATPYRDTDPAIREKYSFANWVRYILQIAPHLPITLPAS